jgi:hypothetical protein
MPSTQSALRLAGRRSIAREATERGFTQVRCSGARLPCEEKLHAVAGRKIRKLAQIVGGRERFEALGDAVVGQRELGK